MNLYDHLLQVGHPHELQAKLEAITHRKIHLLRFEDFREGMVLAKDPLPEQYWSYVLLTKFFPRCIDAVLSGEEKVDAPELIMAVRQFGCSHVMACLYDALQPYAAEVWNDAILDHVRLWTADACPVCQPPN
jgi:hypothetical protein